MAHFREFRQPAQEAASSKAEGKEPDTDAHETVHGTSGPAEGPAKKVARITADCEADKQAASPPALQSHELPTEPSHNQQASVDMPEPAQQVVADLSLYSL